MLKTMALRSALIAFTCSISVAAYAIADTPRSINVPAGNLTDALESLAKECGVDVIYPAAQLRDLKTNGVSGTLETKEAFRKLLEGTPLILKLEGSAVLITLRRSEIVATAPSSAASAPEVALSTESAAPSRSKGFWQRLRLAQGEADEPGGKRETSAARSEKKDTVEEFEPTVKGMPEVLIKGSKTLNSDIQRTKDDIQPYVIYTAEEIQRSMATNLEDFFRSRLTMSAPPTDSFGELTGSFSQSPSSGSNQSQISLRGLGVDETLILVNGRRRPGVSYINSPMFKLSTKGGFGQPDINGIPLESIERIEVLPATASGIYGGGATGGVINIILKTNYSGLDVSVEYANTFDTDSTSKRWSANGGFTLEDGKTSIAFSGSYSEQNEMLIRDRDFTLRSRQRQVRNSPESFYSNESTEIPVGFTPNIKNNAVDCNELGECTFANLVLKDGLVDIGSPITYLPTGYSGDVQQLIDNSGSYNLDLANDVSNGGRSIQSGPRINSLNLTVSRQFSDTFSMFANVSRAENAGSVLFAGLPNSASIDADSPTNPFTTDIRVTFPVPGFAFKQEFQSESVNAVMGAALRLPFHWQAQLEGSWGKSRTISDGGSPFLIDDLRDPPIDGPIVRTGLDSAIRTGEIDVLRDLNRSTLDLSAFELPYPNAGMSPADSLSSGGLLRLSGPLFHLPGGDVALSALLDHRKDVAKAAFTRSQAESLGENLFFYYPGRQTTTDSFYLEANVPLVTSLNERPWLRIFELQASARRDSNKTRSVPTAGIQVPNPDEAPDSITYTESTEKATGYTVGFRAAAIRDVVLRMSFGHGFLPPSIAQIGSTIINTATVQYGIGDPLRLYEEVGTQADATIVIEGNPNLKSESSNSFSTGLIVTPRFLEGVRLSIDYTQIKKTDEISGVDIELLMRNPELYPGRVVRGPELGDGLPGPITYLDTTLINIDQTTVKALDLQLNYSLATERAGSFNFYAVATRQNEYSRRLTQISSVTNSVGFRDGPLEWRGNAGIDWYRGALTVGWNMQHFASYKVYQSTDSPDTAEYYVDIQGARSIPAQTYHDISFRYWFGDGMLSKVRAFRGMVLTGGIQNVFDTSPPIDATSGDVGYSTYGDPLMRRYTLQLTKSF